MASPAVKAPATGTHVLFIVRNPNGISSVISYLNSRSIKSWTSTSLPDALPKIKNHNIQMVFVSLSLKNVSVPAIIEGLKTQHNLPVVIFSEDVSRKVETDMAKLVTKNKIIPPNQNAKFLQAVQSNLGAINNAGGTGGGNVEDLLPANVEPLEGTQVPEQGRWLKINVDEKAVAPFTYKLIQPRSATVGRTRYFYVGPKNPDMAMAPARGWLASEGGIFYISGRIVEVAPEPEEPTAAKTKNFQMSEEEAGGPLTTHWSMRSEKAGGEEDGEAVEMKVSRQHVGPGPTKSVAVKQGAMAQRVSQVNQQLKQKMAEFTDKIAAFSKWSPKMAKLNKMFESMGNALTPDFGAMIDKVLGRTGPKTTREPANIIEQKLLKASLSAVNRPLKDTELNDQEMVEKIGVAFVKSNNHQGFVVSDLNNFSDENFATFEKLIEVLKTRFARDGQPLEVLLPPSIVCIEPIPLVAKAKENSHFLLHAENDTERLVCSFVEAKEVLPPEPGEGHDKMNIQPVALDADQKLLFNLYLHLPANEKQLQYFRIGQMVPASTIRKLADNPGTEILIDPTSVASYFGYTAVTAILKKKD